MTASRSDSVQTLKEDKNFSYCPGCGHGIVTRLIAEIIDELDIRKRAIGIVGIGCGGFSHHYMEIDAIEALHGRSPAVATGYKIARPENIVFTYQGDGDSGAIGLAELLHAANRGFPITTVVVNNSVFGMTGGQMSYMSLLEQQTATTPVGRDAQLHGFPLKLTEMMVHMEGVKFLARSSVTTPKTVLQTRKNLKAAFECQLAGRGFAFVEVLSPCPTGLKREPVDAYAWFKENTEKQFPLKVFVNRIEEQRI